MDYYDLVLGSIPGSLLGVTGALSAVGIAFTTALAIGSIIAVALIFHAMFVRTPGRHRQREGRRQPPINSAD